MRRNTYILTRCINRYNMSNYLNKAKDGAVDSRKNDGGSSDRVDPEGLDVDFDEVAFIRAAPTTFTSGVLPEVEGENVPYKNPIIRFKNADYNEGRLDQGYLGFILEDAQSIVEEGTEGTVILKTDEQDNTDIRLFNEDDDQTKIVDGMGVKFGDRLYEGEFVDELPEGRVILTVSGASAKNVAKRVDKKGDLVAGMDEEDGGVNDGLIEYKPNDLREGGQEITSRYARDPEPKTDLLGKRLGIMLARREELDDEDTGYAGEDTDFEDLGDDEHNDSNKASYRELVEQNEARGMYWYVVFDMEAEVEVEEEVTDEEIDGYTWLDKEWGQFDPSVGGIPDDQWEFVEEYVDAVGEGDVSADEDNIRANIEDAASEFDAAPEADSMVNAIRNRV